VSDKDEERIRQAAADAGCGTVILSSEGAYSYLSLDDVAALKRFTGQLFDDVKVVAYVRGPLGFISSSFQAWIAAHRLSTFTPRYKGYRGFENFDRVFGRENVHLWKYDRASFPGGDVVQHFCASLGLRPLSSPEVNAALSRPAASAIYRLNREARTDDCGSGLRALQRARKVIIRQFPHQDWPKFRLSPALIQPLIDANEDDLNWIEKRLGCSLRDDHSPHPDDVTSEADLLKIDPRAIASLVALAEGLPRYPRSVLKDVLSAACLPDSQSHGNSRPSFRQKLSKLGTSGHSFMAALFRKVPRKRPFQPPQ
jgi:hypothetical protein